MVSAVGTDELGERAVEKLRQRGVECGLVSRDAHHATGRVLVTLNDAGWQIGRAKLIGVEDALGADNERPFVLDVRPPTVYALVTREPAVPRPTSSHFLERALVPMAQNKATDTNSRGEQVLRIDPPHFDRDAIAGADLIVLDHPGRLSNEQTNLLASLMRRGKAVLYVAAEPVETDGRRVHYRLTEKGIDLGRAARNFESR
jgi:hypothetical protein